MLKIALTHDIDRIEKTYQFISKPLKFIRNGEFNNSIKSLKSFIQKDNYWKIDDIINIEEKYGVKSTFFILNESIKFNVLKPSTFVLAYGRYSIYNPRLVDTIKWLDKNGWEIGVHGSYNSYKDKDLLQKEKETLEDIVGHEIIGIRQHHLNLNDQTWKIQNELGFKYDSSYGSNMYCGFLNNQFNPFYPKNTNILVIPQVIMDICLMRNQNYIEEITKCLDLAEDNDAIVVVNFHNDKFNTADYPFYRDAYIEIIEQGKSRNARFKTLKEFNEEIRYSQLDIEELEVGGLVRMV